MKDSCIVLADRRQNVLEGIRGLIEDLVGSVVMVADQPSLQKALEQMQPKIAIVDLGLLGSNEITEACELNQRFPGVNIIVMSDYSEPDVINHIMSAGASAYVLKHYAGSDLFDAIQSIQKGQTFISPSIRNKNHSQEQKERTEQ